MNLWVVLHLYVHFYVCYGSAFMIHLLYLVTGCISKFINPKYQQLLCDWPTCCHNNRFNKNTYVSDWDPSYNQHLFSYYYKTAWRFIIRKKNTIARRRTCHKKTAPVSCDLSVMRYGKSSVHHYLWLAYNVREGLFWPLQIHVHVPWTSSVIIDIV